MRILLSVFIIIYLAGTLSAITAPQEIRQNFLSQFYIRHFDLTERGIAEKAVKLLLPDYNENERKHVAEEVLSVHHLVYHDTKWHHIEDNLSMVRRYERVILGMAKRYGVPDSVVLGVLVWENSGGTGKLSYTGNIGFGQLGRGAVALSHAYGARMSVSLREKAREQHRLAKATGSRHEQQSALALQREAHEYDLTAKHRHLAKQFHVADERSIPLANIEDTVVFLKILLKAYADRADLAIAAYHNGMKNMDDLLWVFIERKGWGRRNPKEVEDDGTLQRIIKERQITYLALWREQYLREIMSGLRAMSGEASSEKNNFDTLGDESDLYLWKIVGAFGAYNAPSNLLFSLKKKYYGRKDQSDIEGLSSFSTDEQVKKGLAIADLVSIDKITARPALIGLIHKLGIQKKKRVLILGVLSAAPDIPTMNEEDRLAENIVHLSGLAVDIDITDCKDKGSIRKTLKWLYHFDKIYLVRLLVPEKIIYHIVVNPRYAYEFERFAVKQ